MILLVNPPIYDFTAYDLWAKPLGLLYVGGLLKRSGVQIDYVDALGHNPPRRNEQWRGEQACGEQGRDKRVCGAQDGRKQACGERMCGNQDGSEQWRSIQGRGEQKRGGQEGHGVQGLVTQLSGKARSRPDGRGNYIRQIIEKPRLLKHIPRHYARYGIDHETLCNLIANRARPEAVFITSIMTYWYPGVREVVDIVREVFPGVPVVVGGVYATLMPDHARRTLEPDILFTGPAEFGLWDLLDDLGIKYQHRPQINSFSDMPSPAMDLVHEPEYGLVMTTRGCPNNCSFCAQRQLYPRFERREPAAVIDEILDFHKRSGVRDFAFYDDALFTDKDKHIKPILAELAGYDIRLHSPNGLFAGLIDMELALLMKRSGFKTIRLSLESIDPELFSSMSGKIDPEGFVTGVENLIAAGYSRSELATYIMTGLPGQSESGVRNTIDFLHDMGLPIKLSVFSPVPGTRDFKRAVNMGLLQADTDPLLTNETAYALTGTPEEWAQTDNLRDYVRKLNRALNYP